MACKTALLAFAALALMPADSHAATSASAVLKNAKGEVVANVALRQTASQGVWLNIVADNLPPGPHGFHIHETGRCAPDFKAAGGHFAPNRKEHGALSDKGAHAGDLPNIHVPQTGRLTAEFFAPALSLDGSAPNTLMDSDGSAIVVHAGVDDYRSQPAGDAGDRIACGVIEPVAQ